WGMMPYADASFLIALLIREKHSSLAWRLWEELETEITFSRLAELEVAAVLHRLRVTKVISGEEFNEADLKFDHMIKDGELIRRKVPPHWLYPQAHTLVEHFSEGRAFKSLDILHVASAMALHADTFLTFDE